jgi:hypothetical protein
MSNKFYFGTRFGFTEIPELAARINGKGGNPMRVYCISSLKFLSQVNRVKVCDDSLLPSQN